MNDVMNRLPRAIAVMIAIVSGAVVFGNYFWQARIFAIPGQFLVKLVVLVSGAAMLMAALNLVWRHGKRLQAREGESLLVVGGFIIALGAGLMPGGFQSGLGRIVYHWFLAPGMSAIFALLPIFLAYALLKDFNLRDIGGFLLFLGMVIVILGQIPALATQFAILPRLRQFLLAGPGAAAFRGVILGLAIGVILAILMKLISFLDIFKMPDVDKGEDGQ